MIKTIIAILLLVVYRLVRDDVIVVTPSYKIQYHADGTIAWARCKITGRFASVSKAIVEMNTYKLNSI